MKSSQALITLGVFTILITAPATLAQDTAHQGHSAQPEAQDLQGQIAELRAQVARLEAALAGGHTTDKAPASGSMDGGMQGMSGMGMGGKGMGGGMQGMSGMGMGGGMQGMSGKGMGDGMQGMSGKGMGDGMQGMSGMGMGDGMQGMSGMGMGDGMQMMGRMRGMRPGEFLTSLPGFPGISHIYHVGATAHFLDHAEHLESTPEQLKRLAEIREAGMLEQATLERRIEDAEQELWTQTSSDAPDAQAIEDTVREIANLQAERRLAFIRSVGAAAQVLTEEQRSRLAGDAEQAPAEMSAHEH